MGDPRATTCVDRVAVASGVVSAVASRVVAARDPERVTPLRERHPRPGDFQKTIPVPSRRSP